MATWLKETHTSVSVVAELGLGPGAWDEHFKPSETAGTQERALRGRTLPGFLWSAGACHERLQDSGG